MQSEPLISGEFSRNTMVGQVEYGFYFRRAGDAKTEFEVIIGHVDERVRAADAVRAVMERTKAFRWIVDAIIAADEARKQS